MLIGTFVTITAASGAGKSTLEEFLVAHFGGGRIVTHTSRAPRPGETSANYIFRNVWALRFIRLVRLFRQTDYLWIKNNHGNLYSGHVPEFYKAMKQTGKIAFVSITPDCHKLVADRFEPEGFKCVAIHLKHPGDAELRRRLEQRPGTTEEDVERRLQDSREFEQTALQIAIQTPNLHLIEPGTPEEVFEQVLAIIAS